MRHQTAPRRQPNSQGQSTRAQSVWHAEHAARRKARCRMEMRDRESYLLRIVYLSECTRARMLCLSGAWLRRVARSCGIAHGQIVPRLLREKRGALIVPILLLEISFVHVRGAAHRVRTTQSQIHGAGHGRSQPSCTRSDMHSTQGHPVPGPSGAENEGITDAVAASLVCPTAVRRCRAGSRRRSCRDRAPWPRAARCAPAA